MTTDINGLRFKRFKEYRTSLNTRLILQLKSVYLNLLMSHYSGEANCLLVWEGISVFTCIELETNYTYSETNKLLIGTALIAAVSQMYFQKGRKN